MVGPGGPKVVTDEKKLVANGPRVLSSKWPAPASVARPSAASGQSAPTKPTRRVLTASTKEVRARVVKGKGNAAVYSPGTEASCLAGSGHGRPAAHPTRKE